MGTIYATKRAGVTVRLDVHAYKCTGCRICELLCSFHHEDVAWPAVKVEALVALYVHACRFVRF